jgi:hypothetical protein
MATEWYLEKTGQWVGPFSSLQLRELALAGKLKKDDELRKGESGNPVPAGKVKNLFSEDKREDRPRQPPPRLPQPESFPTESLKFAPTPLPATSQLKGRQPPPLPQDVDASSGSSSDSSESPSLPPADTAPSRRQEILNIVFDKSKTLVRQFSATAKSAALLTRRQAERTKILNVSLPKEFTTLGEYVYSTNAFRDEFPNSLGQLDDLHAKVEELESRVRSRPAGEKFTDKAKSVAASTKDRAEAQVHRLQLSRLTAKFGKEVFEKHGESSGPRELISPIEKLLSRCDVLTAEIDELSKRNVGSLVTPKRLAIGGIVFICVIVGMISISLVTPDAGPGTTSGATSEGVANFKMFSDHPSQFIGSDRFVGKPLTISGRWTRAGASAGLDGGRYSVTVILDSVNPSVNNFAWCIFDKEPINDPPSQCYITGMYAGMRKQGVRDDLELVGCRLASKKEIAAIIAITEPPAIHSVPKQASPLSPAPGRELQVAVHTSVETRSAFIKRACNPSLSSVECHATSDQVIIDFDADLAKWPKRYTRKGNFVVEQSNTRFPLLVRFFDKNGAYLTRFTTIPFTASPEDRDDYIELYEDVKKYPKATIEKMTEGLKCKMLKERGNRLLFNVPIRDLRDAAIVEIGFTDR